MGTKTSEIVKLLSTLPPQVLEPLRGHWHSRLTVHYCLGIYRGHRRRNREFVARQVEVKLAERHEPAAGGQHVGHAHIVRLGGQAVDQFVVAHDGDQPGCRIGQRKGTVIEPGSAA